MHLLLKKLYMVGWFKVLVACSSIVYVSVVFEFSVARVWVPFVAIDFVIKPVFSLHRVKV